MRKISEEYMKLLEYVRNHAEPGNLLEYRVVEGATGVKMDRDGRDKLRRAIERTKLEYQTLKGEAYRLAESSTAMEILGHKVIAIDNRVLRADKAHKILESTFKADFSPREQNQIKFLGSVFGAIRLAAENAKLVYGKKKLPQLVSGQPIIPDNL